ncbi:MAG: CapA family protein [Armatimonadota bacterium]|nr:CapA family protein [Armatimonadota bacterium]
MPTATLALTGDLMLNRPIVQGGRSPGSAGVWALLEGADLVFANLECPLTSRSAPADKVVAFRSDPHLARDLVAAGVDVVTLANNHMYDQGVHGMFDTLAALRDAGLAPVGAGEHLDAALRPAVLPADGMRIAFLGVATTLPVGCAAAPDRPGLAPIRVTTSYVADASGLEETPGIAPFVETRAWPGDVETVVAAIAAARRQADACVVGIHWGVPNGWVAQFQDPLATYQRPLARALVRAGADVVVGHHPHVLHGIEMIDGRPVFYSLGNFVFHTLRVGVQPALRRPDPPYSWRSLRSPVNLDSAVALVTLDTGRVAAIQIVPVLLNGVGDPELATGADAARILTTLGALSEPLGTRIAPDGDRGRVELRGSEP